MSYPDGVVVDRRKVIAKLFDRVGDPIFSLPPACYRDRMVLSRDAGKSRAFVIDPALIHELLVGNADALNKTPVTQQVLGPLLGDGIFTSNGRTWRRQRQILAPAFQHDNLTELLPIMIGAAEATRDRLLSLPKKAIVDLSHEMMHTTFQIIVDTMLSGLGNVEAAQIERALSDYLKATPWMLATAVLQAPGWTPYPGKRRALAAIRCMRQAMESRLDARDSTADPGDLTAILAAIADPEAGTQMAATEIVDNILTFMLAGHETTAVALGWTLGLLVQHPRHLERLRAEIQSVVGDGPITAAHVPMLTFARQVMSEGMRLYPPLPLIVRRLLSDIELGNVPIRAETIFIIPVYALHHRATLWPDPYRFDPDRFSSEAVKTRHRYAYLPFGAGPRICIGNSFALLEAVAILAVLVKALRFDRVDAALPPATMQLTLRPKRPIRMRVSRQ